VARIDQTLGTFGIACSLSKKGLYINTIALSKILK